MSLAGLVFSSIFVTGALLFLAWYLLQRRERGTDEEQIQQALDHIECHTDATRKLRKLLPATYSLNDDLEKLNIWSSIELLCREIIVLRSMGLSFKTNPTLDQASRAILLRDIEKRMRKELERFYKEHEDVDWLALREEMEGK